ncbi:MAG: PepSY domain-containing protein [Anaerolineae bacterium]|nr:PepSY domain-containing protein [Anaerolineae bacterium]
MHINQKSLIAIVLLTLLLGTMGGVALVAAQGKPSSIDAPANQTGNDDEGEGETPASSSDAALTEAEAIAIAEAERSSKATFIELEHEAGLVVYSIELEDGSEVEVDASTGAILEIEGSGSDDD